MPHLASAACARRTLTAFADSKTKPTAARAREQAWTRGVACVLIDD
jgi:hypothetical protein